ASDPRDDHVAASDDLLLPAPAIVLVVDDLAVGQRRALDHIPELGVARPELAFRVAIATRVDVFRALDCVASSLRTPERVVVERCPRMTVAARREPAYLVGQLSQRLALGGHFLQRIGLAAAPYEHQRRDGATKRGYGARTCILHHAISELPVVLRPLRV